MSNDDERMDRAKRIREMREGSREGDNDEAADGGEPDSPEPDDTDTDDGGTEKQTMEDLVESAAADADDAAEIELDDDPLDDDFEEMDATDAEEEVAAQVADAVSDDDTDDTEDELTEPDDTAETEPPAADDDVAAPLPDTETLEDALDEGEGGDVETATPDSDEEMPAAPGTETESETQGEETRVLEFRLDDEYYCLDIAYIEEIVKEETITRVPNTPEYVQGVVDLRGQITTILNPKVTLGKDRTETDQLIVVFDSEAFDDQGHIGWVVDDVRQVSPITDSEVNDPPVEDDHINGVIDREDDDQFVIWTSPDLALEEADG